MVLSVLGPYAVKRIEEMAQKFFGEVNHSFEKVEFSPFTHYRPQQIQKKFSNYQSHAVVGGLAFDLHNHKRLHAALLTNIIGGPALNSRLSMSIREKHGLAYSVESNYSPFVDTGYHSIYFGTEQKHVEKCLNLLHKELHKLKTQNMGKIQLAMAKEQFKGHLALASENNTNVMLGLGKSVLIYDKIESTSSLFQNIDSITATDLLDVANEIYDEKGLSSLVFFQEE
jgi:predicted Zn-dependent peptidase